MIRIDPLGTPGHTYIQVASAIAASIEAGQITGRLPAERALAADLGVSYQTVRHAYAVLRQRGLIITRHGRGSYARPRPGTSDD